MTIRFLRNTTGGVAPTAAICYVVGTENCNPVPPPRNRTNIPAATARCEHCVRGNGASSFSLISAASTLPRIGAQRFRPDRPLEAAAPHGVESVHPGPLILPTRRPCNSIVPFALAQGFFALNTSPIHRTISSREAEGASRWPASGSYSLCSEFFGNAANIMRLIPINPG